MYSTELPELEGESLLTLNEGHDYSQVFIDGKLIGSIDRVRKEKSLALPAVKKGSRLTIVVEAMGRINFGRAIKDFKGITNGVTIKTSSDGHELTWDLKTGRWTSFLTTMRQPCRRLA